MDIPLLFDDFALVMLSSLSVCYHTENKNTLKEDQTSTGELLTYRTLPNKDCNYSEATKDIQNPKLKTMNCIRENYCNVIARTAWSIVATIPI